MTTNAGLGGAQESRTGGGGSEGQGYWEVALRAALPPVCPDGPHRGPAGPNEDLAQCPICLGISHSLRPGGETFGTHADDCSLPIGHEGYCAPGGSGHPAADTVRGYFPPAAGYPTESAS